MPARLGITQRVVVNHDYGERRDALDQAWTQRLHSLGYLPVPLPNQTTNVENVLADYGLSGVILTGGNDLCDLRGAVNTAPERDAFENRLLDVAAEHDVPVVGICRGMQLMLSHYDGCLRRVHGHIGRPHQVVGSPDAPKPLLHRETVNSFHGFGATTDDVGNRLRVLAYASDGTVEAIRHRRLRQWGIMWHPEREPYSTCDGDLLQLIFSTDFR